MRVQAEVTETNDFKYFILIFWKSLIYSPFILVGIYTGAYTFKQFQLHWVVCVVFGIAAMFFLYFVMGQLFNISKNMKQSKPLVSLTLSTILALLTSGIPFYYGIIIAQYLIPPNEISMLEQIIIYGIAGLILGIPAYIGVTHNFRVYRVS